MSTRGVHLHLPVDSLLAFDMAAVSDVFVHVPNPLVRVNGIPKLPSFGIEVDVLSSVGKGRVEQHPAAVVYALHLYQFQLHLFLANYLHWSHYYYGLNRCVVHSFALLYHLQITAHDYRLVLILERWRSLVNSMTIESNCYRDRSHDSLLLGRSSWASTLNQYLLTNSVLAVAVWDCPTLMLSVSDKKNRNIVKFEPKLFHKFTLFDLLCFLSLFGFVQKTSFN